MLNLVIYLYYRFMYLKYPFTFSCLIETASKTTKIDIIKFSDKNRWRQGKTAVGFPEFLDFCVDYTFLTFPLCNA